MGKTRHYEILRRYQVLDQLLRKASRQGAMTCQELADDLNEVLYGRDFEENEQSKLVRSRVVREDIRGINELTGGAVEVLSYQRADSRYRYRNDSISLYNHSLNVEEGRIVREGLERLGLLASSEGMKFLLCAEGQEKGFLELLRQCFFPEDEQLKELVELDQPIILPERQKETHDVLGVMKEIHAAILDQVVLSVEKHDFDGEIERFQFHPYVLKQYNARWWAFGYDPLYTVDGKKPALFRKVRLDKIHELRHWDDKCLPEKKLGGEFQPSPVTDWETGWFDQMIGVSTNHKPVSSADLHKETMYLAFSPDQWSYEASRPLHEGLTDTNRTLEIGEEQWRIFRLRLYPNYEFYKKVAELRGQVVILSPSSVRDEAKRVAANLLALYELPVVKEWTLE